MDLLYEKEKCVMNITKYKIIVMLNYCWEEL